jgi:hypothetical protein
MLPLDGCPPSRRRSNELPLQLRIRGALNSSTARE